MATSHETEKGIEEEGPWKNLSNDILALILKRLNTKADLCRFRSICKSWRSFATPIQPNLYFPLTIPAPQPNSRPFSLSLTLYYILSPNFTLHNNNNNNNSNINVWLIKVSETQQHKWTLLKPLTKKTLRFPSSWVFNKTIDLLKYQNLEVGRSYGLDLINDRGLEYTFDGKIFSNSIYFRKIVVHIGDFLTVLGLFGHGQIGIWNSGDGKWKIVEIEGKEKRNDFGDVICYDGKFYAINKTGRLVMIDSTALELVEVVSSTEECNGQCKYLVESDFRLYLVNIVYPRPTDYYDEQEQNWVVDKISLGKPFVINVFVLNEREKIWEKVRSLENKVFFVSRDTTFSVRAEDLGWSKGDCIYVGGLDSFDFGAHMSFGLNAVVYTLEDEAITIMGSSMDHWTGIFWPLAELCTNGIR